MNACIFRSDNELPHPILLPPGRLIADRKNNPCHSSDSVSPCQLPPRPADCRPVLPTTTLSCRLPPCPANCHPFLPTASVSCQLPKGKWPTARTDWASCCITPKPHPSSRHEPCKEREIFIDNLLVRVHLIIEMRRPALRHGSLNSLFQVALYLPCKDLQPDTAPERATAGIG